MLGPKEEILNYKFCERNSAPIKPFLSPIILQTYLIFECPISESKLISLENYRREGVFDTPVSSSPKMFTCRAEYQILLVRNVRA